jgi:hypothetical protein
MKIEIKEAKRLLKVEQPRVRRGVSKITAFAKLYNSNLILSF